MHKTLHKASAQGRREAVSRAMVWVVILIQRTGGSLIIEELRGSKGSDFDTAHERELDY